MDVNSILADASRNLQSFDEGQHPSEASKTRPNFEKLQRAAHEVDEEERAEVGQAMIRESKALTKTTEKSKKSESDTYHENPKFQSSMQSPSNSSIDNSVEEKSKSLKAANRATTFELDTIDRDDNDGDDDSVDVDKGSTDALLIAACRGDRKTVLSLLKNGVSPLCKDRHGWTPLHWASAKGHDDIIEDLVASSSNQRKFINVSDSLTGWTALHVACISGQHHSVSTMLRLGADKNKLNFLHERPCDCISLGTQNARQLLEILGVMVIEEGKDSDEGKTDSYEDEDKERAPEPRRKINYGNSEDEEEEKGRDVHDVVEGGDHDRDRQIRRPQPPPGNRGASTHESGPRAGGRPQPSQRSKKVEDSDEENYDDDGFDH